MKLAAAAADGKLARKRIKAQKLPAITKSANKPHKGTKNSGSINLAISPTTSTRILPLVNGPSKEKEKGGEKRTAERLTSARMGT